LKGKSRLPEPRPQLTLIRRDQIEVRIAQAALEVVNVEDIAWRAIPSRIEQKFVVAVGVIKVFVALVGAREWHEANGQQESREQSFRCHDETTSFARRRFFKVEADARFYFSQW
jgi:hypothetical protein